MLVAFGAAFVAALSANHSQPPASARLTGGLAILVGGGVLGAALEERFADGTRTSARAGTRKVLRDTLRSGLRSLDKDLEPLRNAMHHYHVTMADGRRSWLYSVFRFDQCHAVGSLSASITLRFLDERDDAYTAEAVVRGKRVLLLFTRDDGTEPNCAEVFPAVQTFSREFAGWGVRQTWDDVHMTGKALMSINPLVPGLAPGFVTDETVARHLDEIWQRRFVDTYGMDNLIARRVSDPS